MGQARHLLSLLAPAFVVMAVATGGCGSSDETSQSSSNGGISTTPTAPRGAAAQACTGRVAGAGRLRASGINCATAQRIAASCNDKTACRTPSGAARTSCSVENYRCLGTATERGLAVSCAAAGGSISFIAKRG
jgi:hypothetical protein